MDATPLRNRLLVADPESDLLRLINHAATALWVEVVVTEAAITLVEQVSA